MVTRDNHEHNCYQRLGANGAVVFRSKTTEASVGSKKWAKCLEIKETNKGRAALGDSLHQRSRQSQCGNWGTVGFRGLFNT